MYTSLPPTKEEVIWERQIICPLTSNFKIWRARFNNLSNVFWCFLHEGAIPGYSLVWYQSLYLTELRKSESLCVLRAQNIVAGFPCNQCWLILGCKVALIGSVPYFTPELQYCPQTYQRAVKIGIYTALCLDRWVPTYCKLSPKG